jgi:hypothetical protein
VSIARMTKTTLVAVAVSFAASGTASAGGQEGAIGVGVEAQISKVGGGSINYDAGKFHVGGFLGFQDPEGPNNTEIAFGARFFYHVHHTAMSDFSIGGSLGIDSVPVLVGGMTQRQTLLFIEPGAQIRAFVTSNVALSFTVGFVIGAADAGGLIFDGQTTGTAGVHYYFF